MPEKKSNRVPGHGLRQEGRAFEVRDGRPKLKHVWDAYPSFGIGVCECGSTSPAMRTDAARKQWHREHKTEVQS